MKKYSTTLNLIISEMFKVLREMDIKIIQKPNNTPEQDIKYNKFAMDAVVYARCVSEQESDTSGAFYHGICYSSVAIIGKLHDEEIPKVTELTKDASTKEQAYWLLTNHKLLSMDKMYEKLMDKLYRV